MYKIDCFYLNKRGVLALFSLFLISVLAIGGCNDGNNGGGLNGSDTSQCTTLSDPCSAVNGPIDNDGVIECVLSDATCVVDLQDVINQIQGLHTNVSENSILYMGAWGGNGGSAAENGGKTSPGGYAQTTTTVSDIVSLSGSSLLYYFLGEPGGNAPAHCGGGGGASTIVTFEDLTLNPGAEPTSSLLFMLSGGGGGAGGGTIKGCSNPAGPRGAEGGITIAAKSDTQGLFFFNAGQGCNGASGGCGSSNCGNQCGAILDDGIFTAEGGGGDKLADGGLRMCCVDNQTGSQNGFSGIGGFGGAGGIGVSCTQVQAVGFRNASLSFGTGKGGFGGGGTDKCTDGGGGGGGGFGGGGGGGHGSTFTSSQSGGGGGSAAMSSTQDTSKSPSARPTNPCGTSGCVTITIFVD